MATDYIPADDAGLLNFADNFCATISGSEAAFGLVAADFTSIDALRDDFQDKKVANDTAQNAARVARQTKDLTRTNLVNLLRSHAKRVQAFPGTSAAELVSLGLTVRDTTPTAVAAPTSQPVLFIGTQNRLSHEISFRDSLTPTSKAKPAGVLGCEIYRKVGGAAPASIAECEFLGLDSATPYVAEYGAESAGVMVHYMGRWANRNGLTGPQSDVMSATVVG